jgi:hypothetical protein
MGGFSDDACTSTFLSGKVDQLTTKESKLGGQERREEVHALIHIYV